MNNMVATLRAQLRPLGVACHHSRGRCCELVHTLIPAEANDLVLSEGSYYRQAFDWICY